MTKSKSNKETEESMNKACVADPTDDEEMMPNNTIIDNSVNSNERKEQHITSISKENKDTKLAKAQSVVTDQCCEDEVSSLIKDLCHDNEKTERKGINTTELRLEPEVPLKSPECMYDIKFENSQVAIFFVVFFHNNIRAFSFKI